MSDRVVWRGTPPTKLSALTWQPIDFYSFTSLPREGTENAKFAAVSKPQNLVELDASAIGKVITVSKQLLAPTPYRGGPVSLELGLFSVKAETLRAQPEAAEL